MKNIKYIGLLIIANAIIGLTACEKTMDYMPSVNLIIDQNPANAEDPVVFTVEGNAELYSLYTGDEGHEWAKSYAVITEGKVLDRERCWLTSVGLDSIIATGIWANDSVDYLRPNLEPLLEDSVFISLAQAKATMNLIFASIINPADSSLVLSDINSNTDVFLNYFTTDISDLTPVGGFNTGFNIDPSIMEMEYVYSEPGTYTVTIVATNIGQKIYSGSGYIDDRDVNANEYPIHREIKEYTLVVQ